MNKKLLLGITLVSIPLLSLLGMIYYTNGLVGILTVFTVVASAALLMYGLSLLEQVREERARAKMFTETAKKAMKKYEKTLRNLKD